MMRNVPQHVTIHHADHYSEDLEQGAKLRVSQDVSLRVASLSSLREAHGRGLDVVPTAPEGALVRVQFDISVGTDPWGPFICVQLVAIEDPSKRVSA
jgi:hypothetical protein